MALAAFASEETYSIAKFENSLESYFKIILVVQFLKTFVSFLKNPCLESHSEARAQNNAIINKVPDPGVWV